MSSPRQKPSTRAKASDNALDEVRALVSELAPMRQLAEEIRQYPVDLMKRVCTLYEKRGAPVPDHQLDLVPFLGETALRALVEGGLLTRVNDQQYAIHAYAPTERSLELVRRLDGKS